MSETPITDAAERGEISVHLAELWIADRKAIKDAFELSRARRWPLVQGVLEQAARSLITINDNSDET